MLSYVVLSSPVYRVAFKVPVAYLKAFNFIVVYHNVFQFPVAYPEAFNVLADYS